MLLGEAFYNGLIMAIREEELRYAIFLEKTHLFAHKTSKCAHATGWFVHATALSGVEHVHQCRPGGIGGGGRSLTQRAAVNLPCPAVRTAIRSPPDAPNHRQAKGGGRE